MPEDSDQVDATAATAAPPARRRPRTIVELYPDAVKRDLEFTRGINNARTLTLPAGRNAAGCSYAFTAIEGGTIPRKWGFRVVRKSKDAQENKLAVTLSEEASMWLPVPVAVMQSDATSHVLGSYIIKETDSEGSHLIFYGQLRLKLDHPKSTGRGKRHA